MSVDPEPSMDLNQSEDQTVRVQRALWRHWGTPAAIYGTIVYASVVAASSLEHDHPDSALRILAFSLISIVVFWLAHVYSTALGFHGDAAHVRDRLRDSLRHAMAESAGMLEAAVIPSVPLLLATLGVLDAETAVTIALWLAVLMLALLGYLVFLVRGRPVGICLLGAVITGLFGVVVILLKIALH
ncbi:hypothetical protein [Leifsonia aquatica]|uniref:Uncharacterized protein n=2 Tax=Leifsonia aquatica TaxID=144185 RepID=U2RXX9_LEIAQ|nr:hypothetical protein [Leifsonia aquatica]ERK73601.1 hypothetical protein N136_00033 [Leifsonia aquatica ATCC 14665]MBB2965693.1 hypothetical protein [Leifsonia aquatica]